MTNYEDKVINYFKGESIAQTKDLKTLGVSSKQIQKMVDKKLIKRVSRGIYSLPDTIDDSYYELQLKYQQLVFSHDTALSLHNLTDVTPSKITGTVPRNYNYQYLVKEVGLNVIRVSPKRYELGIEEVLSPFGNMIKVTNKERTLCDILLKRNQIDSRIINEGFKEYLSDSKKNLNKLVSYSKLFKVEKLVRNYIEVLL